MTVCPDRYSVLAGEGKGGLGAVIGVWGSARHPMLGREVDSVSLKRQEQTFQGLFVEDAVQRCGGVEIGRRRMLQ